MADRPADSKNRTQLLKSIEAMQGKRVLVVGDVMVDEYLTGSTDRISPEAPVPVVLVEQEKKLMGGAGNVAANIKALQGIPLLIGVCGQDAAGDFLLENLAQTQISGRIIPLPRRPTTIKTRIMAQRQQMLRIDKENPSGHDRSETELVLTAIREHMAGVTAVVVSDYGKGLVTRKMMEGLHCLCREQKKTIPILIDPKPVNKPCYTGATLLTPNAKETALISNHQGTRPEDIITAGQRILDELHLPSLLTTLGAEGMAVFEKGGIWHIPTTARNVFDVTGAGDTVIATVATALAAKRPLIESCILANYAAGIVVGEVGAATATPQDLKQAIVTLPMLTPTRWK